MVSCVWLIITNWQLALNTFSLLTFKPYLSSQLELPMRIHTRLLLMKGSSINDIQAKSDKIGQGE